MALQTVLFLIGLVIIALVFWFSGGRDLLMGGGGRERLTHKRSKSDSSEPKLEGGGATGEAPVAWDDDALDGATDLTAADRIERGRESGGKSAVQEEQYEGAADTHSIPAFLLSSEKSFTGVNIDYCAYVTGEGSVTRAEVLDVYRQSEFDLPKAHRIYARRSEDQRWRDLELEGEGAEYEDVAITMQLADRDGPVNQSHLTRFSSLVLRTSEALERKFQFSSSFEDALSHAQNLDEFCKQYDVIAAIYILAEGPGVFTGPAIDDAARKNAMQIGQRNIYHRMSARNGAGYSTFSLANIYNPGGFELEYMEDFTTDGLVMFLNMPCTPSPDNAYREMISTAESICAELGGKLVDQHKKSVSRSGLEGIKQQIEQIARDMGAEGIVPGSVEAIRLFE